MEKFEYPELPAPPKRRKIFDRRSLFFSGMALLLFFILVALQLRNPDVPSAAFRPSDEKGGSAAQARAWTPARQREVAQKLVDKGLKREAVSAFQEYLASADPSMEERANILYTMGKLLFELADYESALAAFYQAESAAPSPSIKEEMDRKVFACLERMGKPFDAQSELERRTSLTPPTTQGEGREGIVARIGNEIVTLGQIHDEIQKLQATQPQLAESLKSDRTKLLQFLRQFLFEKLLARKARKLGIDQQPEFRKQMEDIMDQSLANTLIRQEIQAKVKVEAGDIELYYKANRDRYVQKGRATVSHILLEDEETARKVLAMALEGKDFAQLAREYSKDAATQSEGGKLAQPLVEDSKDVPGIGPALELVKTAFATPPGQVAHDLLQSSYGFHVLKVHELAPSRPLSFDEARQAAAYDYQLEKTQAAISRMLQETLQVERVQIYEDQILGQKTPLTVQPPKE